MTAPKRFETDWEKRDKPTRALLVVRHSAALSVAELHTTHRQPLSQDNRRHLQTQPGDLEGKMAHKVHGWAPHHKERGFES